MREKESGDEGKIHYPPLKIAYLAVKYMITNFQIEFLKGRSTPRLLNDHLPCDNHHLRLFYAH
jgi:hypothetical protein